MLIPFSPSSPTNFRKYPFLCFLYVHHITLNASVPPLHGIVYLRVIEGNCIGQSLAPYSCLFKYPLEISLMKSKYSSEGVCRNSVEHRTIQHCILKVWEILFCLVCISYFFLLLHLFLNSFPCCNLSFVLALFLLFSWEWGWDKLFINFAFTLLSNDN